MANARGKDLSRFSSPPRTGRGIKGEVSKDLLTKSRRSWNMSRIRGKNTTPEMIVRSMLHKMGYRFRLHVKIPIPESLLSDVPRSRERETLTSRKRTQRTHDNFSLSASNSFSASDGEKVAQPDEVFDMLKGKEKNSQSRTK